MQFNGSWRLYSNQELWELQGKLSSISETINYILSYLRQSSDSNQEDAGTTAGVRAFIPPLCFYDSTIEK